MRDAIDRIKDGVRYSGINIGFAIPRIMRCEVETSKKNQVAIKQ